LLARSHGYSGGAFSAHSFYHADGNGNVTYLISSTQVGVAEYRYDPYGNLRYTYDPLPSGGNRYRFSSKEQMPNSGLYYYGYRFYDPNLQRWLNRDPIGEGGFEVTRSRGPSVARGEPNRYLFVRNRPTGLIDSDGLDVISIPFPIELPPIPIPAWAPPVAAGAAGGAIGWGLGTWLCRAFPDVMLKPGELVGDLINPRKQPPEYCPLEDQHDMGPVAGYRCEYWCRKSGKKPVIYVPHSEGGCPKYVVQ
jgi:RHS repeat-associated protein